jgi:hypothetical protein
VLSVFRHPKKKRQKKGGGGGSRNTKEKKLRKKILLNTKLLQCNMFIKKVFTRKKKGKTRKGERENKTSLKLNQKTIT